MGLTVLIYCCPIHYMGHRTIKQDTGACSIHPELIKARIRIDFGSVEAFEKARGLGHQTVRDVLRGRPVRRTALALAEFMGKPVSELFPGRFITRHHKSPKRDSHCLNAEAA